MATGIAPHRRDQASAFSLKSFVDEDRGTFKVKKKAGGVGGGLSIRKPLADVSNSLHQKANQGFVNQKLKVEKTKKKSEKPITVYEDIEPDYFTRMDDDDKEWLNRRRVSIGSPVQYQPLMESPRRGIEYEFQPMAKPWNSPERREEPVKNFLGSCCSSPISCTRSSFVVDVKLPESPLSDVSY